MLLSLKFSFDVHVLLIDARMEEPGSPVERIVWYFYGVVARDAFPRWIIERNRGWRKIEIHSDKRYQIALVTRRGRISTSAPRASN